MTSDKPSTPTHGSIPANPAGLPPIARQTAHPPVPPAAPFGLVVFGVFGVVLLAGAGVFFGIVPSPWKASAAPPVREERAPRVELVVGMPNTVSVPEDVRRSLGLRKGEKDAIFEAQAPTQSQILVLPGSTALDPTTLMRVRARFAPPKSSKSAPSSTNTVPMARAAVGNCVPATGSSAATCSASSTRSMSAPKRTI